MMRANATVVPVLMVAVLAACVGPDDVDLERDASSIRENREEPPPTGHSHQKGGARQALTASIAYSLPQSLAGLDGPDEINPCFMAANADETLIGTVTSVSDVHIESGCDPASHDFAHPYFTADVELVEDGSVRTVTFLQATWSHSDVAVGKRIVVSIRAARGREVALAYLFFDDAASSSSTSASVQLPDTVETLRTQLETADAVACGYQRWSDGAFESHVYGSNEPGYCPNAVPPPIPD